MILYDKKSPVRWFPSDSETSVADMKDDPLYAGMFCEQCVLMDDGAGSAYSWVYLSALATRYGAEEGATPEETLANIEAAMKVPPYDPKTATDALDEQMTALSGEAEPDNTVAMLAQIRAAAKFAVQAADLSDSQALEVSSLYPRWETGQSYAVKAIVRYDGHLFRCNQAHTSSDVNNTTVASLWNQIDFDGGIEVWKQPTGAHDAYAKGTKVRHSGKVWESLVDGNVWEPGAAGTDSLWRESE